MTEKADKAVADAFMQRTYTRMVEEAKELGLGPVQVGEMISSILLAHVVQYVDPACDGELMDGIRAALTRVRFNMDVMSKGKAH